MNRVFCAGFIDNETVNVIQTRGFAVFLLYVCFLLSVYYMFLQYFDTVGWVF